MKCPSKAAKAGDKVASSAAADPGLSAKVLVCNCKLKCIIRLVVIQSSTIKLDQVVCAQATYKSHPFAQFLSGIPTLRCFGVNWNCLFQAYVVKLYSL